MKISRFIGFMARLTIGPLLTGAFFLCPLHADPLYGYATIVQYGYGLPPDTAGDGGSYQQALDQAADLKASYTLFSSPAFNMEAKASYTAIDLSNQTLYPVSADVGVRQLSGNFAQLHSWTIASTSIGDPNVNGGANVDSTLIWIDHFSFIGAPAGTPVQYQILESLDGSLITSGGYYKTSTAYVQINVQGGSFLVQEVASKPSNVFDDTRTITLTSAVGQNLEFEEELITSIGGQRSFSAEAILADTAKVYVNVLTPGVSLVSASGYDYAPELTSVPEPCCSGLVGSSLFIWVLLTLGRIKSMNIKPEN